MNEKVIYDKLTKEGMRIFAIRLVGGTPNDDYMLFIHADKTGDEFRNDIKIFKKRSFGNTDTEASDDRAFNEFMEYLRDLGYAEVLDVVADVFEGSIMNECSRIIDDPSHEEQEDGFGHFGWGHKKE